MTYQIKDWETHFENNRSKAIVNTDWVPIPNKQDGDGYTELMADKNGTLFLGCWIALVELASKCHPRGTLVRSDGRPHDLPSISRITRVPEAILKQSLPKLISIGWIITSDTASACHQMAPACIEGREGIEGKEGKGITPEVVITKWNSLGEPFPKVLKLTDGRSRTIKTRLADKWWSDHWLLALDILKTLDFCKGKNDRGWVADLEFFLRPDSVPKILEGKYGAKATPASKPRPKNDDMTSDEIAGIGTRRLNRDTDRYEILINGEWKDEVK